MRPGLVVLLGFVALLSQSSPTLLFPTEDVPGVEGFRDGVEPFLTDGGGDAAAYRAIGHELDGDASDLEEDRRNVTVNILGDDVDIGLESNASDGGDEVKVQFGSVAARLRVSFETLSPYEEQVEMRIGFRELVEFEDGNADGAFSLLHDDVLQWLRVENLQVPVPPETGDFSVDSIIGQRINITYKLPGSTTGAFDLVFQVFGLPTRFDGLILGPTETKIDIRFTEFPFTSNTSQLALGLDIRTDYGLEMDPSLAFDQINATGDEFAAFFRWMPDAVLVDGVVAEAKATVVRESTPAGTLGVRESQQELRIFLAYPRGSEIVHDPIVGITGVDVIPPIPVPTPSFAMYTIGLATAVLLVVGLWALHRRRS